ncbi:D-glycerate dehydrogenase [Shewanella sp. UCD-KL21]|uniref:2-hydroxyacid dehydrogenase n=1 Tax=Shewanella sp. UCD-KL21 TaxID=1917164 RepID=UPI000970E824|nr:D-glycerate dehydrogenase [Shewanella sp. UCD-KL21]
MTDIIVLSRPLPLPPISANGSAIEVRVFEGDYAVFTGAKVYLTTALDAVSADFINTLPTSITLIANIGIGVDNIDLNAAKARSISVTNTPVVTEDTADLAFGLLLATCRRLGANERFLRSGQWSKQAPMAMMGNQVHGKKLGIVGMGNIGQAVARRAKAFNMDIYYYNRSQDVEAEANYQAHYCDSLASLLSTVDIISLHCPLTPESKQIINADSLANCNDGAILINTGRGGLIDDNALIDALKSGKIAAAGLDVFDGEPDFHSGYLDFENVTLTPHIGSATAECRQAMAGKALQNVIAMLEGKPLSTPV